MVKDYNLCDECFEVCKNGSSEFKHAWPAFLWNILRHDCRSAFGGGGYFNQIYSGETLWKIIPRTMRPWWLDSVLDINHHAMYPFEHCSLDNPAPMFEDRTIAMSEFQDNISSGQQCRLHEAMDDERVMLPNVLCPFGCTAYCRVAEKADWDLVIQRFLLKTPLKTINEVDKKYRNYHSMWEQYFRNADDYDCWIMNEAYAIKPSLIITNDGPRVLTCPNHGGGDDHHRLYLPRPPLHNLSAAQTDQLSHITINSRLAKPMKKSSWCTTFQMAKQTGGYTGLDTMNVGTHSDWSKTSELLAQHEGLSLKDRSDIRHLLAQKVACGQASQELADWSIENSQYRFPEGSTERFKHGATYVPFSDNIGIQLARSLDDSCGGLIEAVNDRNEMIRCKRGWPRFINIVQMEDNNGYGYQFRPVPQFQCSSGTPSMMTWTLCSLLSGVKELWHAVDNKVGPWRHNKWEGHILTFIRQHLFQFESIRVESKSPFSRVKSLTKAVDIVNRQSPVPSNIDEDSHPSFGFHFSHEFMCRLFPRADHPTIGIAQSLEDVLSAPREYQDKTVIIVVGSSIPSFFGNNDSSTPDKIVIQDDDDDDEVEHSFELRSVVLLRATDRYSQYISCKPNNFDAIRYVRHAQHQHFWKQERSDKVVTQCNENVVSKLMGMSTVESDTFSPCITLYVKEKDLDVDEWKLKILQSFGGKTHTRCSCNLFPLIPSPQERGKKRKCMKCGRRVESMQCCNRSCSVRLCGSCYKDLPTNEVTTLDPVATADDAEADNRTSGESHSIQLLIRGLCFVLPTWVPIPLEVPTVA